MCVCHLIIKDYLLTYLLTYLSEIAIENAENCRFQQAHALSFDAPYTRRTSANIRINLIPSETSLSYIFAVFIQIFVVGSKICIFSATECVSAFKVIQGRYFVSNRKGICDFLLVINSNFGPILHRFWDTASYWLKIANFSYPTLI